jgi:hypothetical protein
MKGGEIGLQMHNSAELVVKIKKTKKSLCTACFGQELVNVSGCRTRLNVKMEED